VGMPYLIHREAGTLPTQHLKQMTASEIAFVIKQNQQMIDTFTKRNAPGDAEKVQELQAANEQIKLAGLFC
jgi:N-acetylglucosamine-6-phosphate deacetylase